MNVLIIGANQGIGQALAEKCAENPDWQVYKTSRKYTGLNKINYNTWEVHCDINSTESIDKLQLQLSSHLNQIDWLINCAGVLHHDTFMPEKSLKQVNKNQLETSYHTNAVGHLLLIQSLEKLISQAEKPTVSSLSARIGSIKDNHLGGWYAYRMSKAALNMGMKTLAIEWSRKHPHIKFLLLHPGTTDTALSKPFQRRLPKGQLQTATETAAKLITQIQKHQSHSSKFPLFIDYKGQEIEW